MIRPLRLPVLAVVLLTLATAAGRYALAQKPNADMKRKGMSGNPVIEGWYADPEAIVYGKEYWIYPTYSDDYGAPQRPLRRRGSHATPEAGHQQAVPEADVHRRVLLRRTSCTGRSTRGCSRFENVKWAEFALWAPSVIRANRKYYLFFAANDIQSDQEHGGIGVAVADRPSGPFVDALGTPLIDTFVNGAQPIDPFVFRDDDGEHYLYYGGWRHCNVVRLTPDLLGLAPLAGWQPVQGNHPGATTSKARSSSSGRASTT